MTTVKSHGIEFIRHGNCQQCGACGCDEEPCPHWYVKDGKHWCAIYAVRDLVCQACSENTGEEVDHASCIGFPDNPWIHVVRNGQCAYRFERVDGSSMDDLPFLDGKPYRVE